MDESTLGATNHLDYADDPADNHTSVIYPGGITVAYGCNGAKRLTSETSIGRAVGFDYDLAGNRTKVIWPDGNFVYSNFDSLNRVNKVCENGSAGCASGLLATYTLDPLSRRWCGRSDDAGGNIQNLAGLVFQQGQELFL